MNQHQLPTDLDVEKLIEHIESGPHGHDFLELPIAKGWVVHEREDPLVMGSIARAHLTMAWDVWCAAWDIVEQEKQL